MVDYGDMQANGFRFGRVSVHPMSPTNQDEAQYPSSQMPFEGRLLPYPNPESLNNHPSWAENESPSRPPHGTTHFSNNQQGFGQPEEVPSAVPSSHDLLGLSGGSDQRGEKDLAYETMARNSPFEQGFILSAGEDVAPNSLKGLGRPSSSSNLLRHHDPPSRPPFSYPRDNEATTTPLLGTRIWADPEQQFYPEQQLRDGCSFQGSIRLNSVSISRQASVRAGPYSSRNQTTTTNHGNLGYVPSLSRVYQSPDDGDTVQNISTNLDEIGRAINLVQPHNSYYPPYSREHGPLSQHERRDWTSYEPPWSSQDRRVGRQQADWHQNTSPNLGRSEHSDENLSDPVPNQELFSVSSGSEQFTEESSVDLSASTIVQVILPRDLVDANDDVLPNPFGSFPPWDDAPNHNQSRSIHQRLSLQDHHLTNRTSESGLRFASNDPQSLDIPQQQVRSDPSSPSSSITSAASPEKLGTLVCCNICGAKFRGDYRKGNVVRHRKLKHGREEKKYPCESPSCKSEYKRQDARLKHYRKHHVELTSGPATSRKSHP